MSLDSHRALLTSRPELPDDTLLEQLDLPTRISRVLQSQGLKTGSRGPTSMLLTKRRRSAGGRLKLTGLWAV